MLNLNPDHLVLKRGLNLKETHKELLRGKRMGDVGERMLAYYLADVQRTGLHSRSYSSSNHPPTYSRLGETQEQLACALLRYGELFQARHRVRGVRVVPWSPFADAHQTVFALLPPPTLVGLSTNSTMLFLSPA